MKDFTFKCWAKAQTAKWQAKEKLHSMAETFKEEHGGADSIIIAIVIIVIVIALGIIFRDQIGAWVQSLFQKGTEELDGANLDDPKAKVVKPK